MSTSTVNSSQRFTVSHPCPICGGHHGLPQGHGSRCYGFLSDDGRYAHCTREEHAGRILQDGAGTYAHILEGLCNCGKTHSEPQKQATRRKTVREVSHQLRDASGTVLFIHKRKYFDDGSKEVWWEQLNGTRNLGGVKLVDLPLYGIHEFKSGSIAILTEGEPAQEAVASFGISALGTVCGAKSCPGDAALEPLLSIPTVCLWVDNDADGVSHMTKVGKRLIERGHPDVRWLEWSEAPPKGDAADFRARGGTAESLQALMQGATKFTHTSGSDDDFDADEEWLFGGSGWPELIAIPPAAEVPTMPAEMIPEPFRAWITDIADRAKLPLEMVAIPAIVGAGSVAGRMVAIKPWKFSDYKTVPNFWGLLVTRPGWMKSSAVSEGLSPIGRLAAAERDRFERRKDEAAAEVAALEAVLEDLKRRMREAAKNGGTLDDLKAKFAEKTAQLRDAKVTERRFMTHDATVEKLAEILRENPRGMLVIRDELYGLLRSFEKSGRENDRQFYLEAWNGTGDFTSDRIGRGTVYIKALTLSIIGGIQPGRLQGLINDSAAGTGGDDGLLQRFQLTVWPDKLEPWSKPSRYPDREARDRAFRVFERISEFIPSSVLANANYEGDLPYLEFSPFAQIHADKWRDHLETRLRSTELDASPAFQSHLAKYRSLLPELALLFHLIDVAADNGAPGPVNEAPVRLASAWCEFLELHARKIYDIELDRGMAAARVLAKKIREGSIIDCQTVREIYRNQWSGLKTDDIVIEGLAVLVKLNWVRLESVPTGGRATQVVRLHPDLMSGGTL